MYLILMVTNCVGKSSYRKSKIIISEDYYKAVSPEHRKSRLALYARGPSDR